MTDRELHFYPNRGLDEIERLRGALAERELGIAEVEVHVDLPRAFAAEVEAVARALGVEPGSDRARTPANDHVDLTPIYTVEGERWALVDGRVVTVSIERDHLETAGDAADALSSGTGDAPRRRSQPDGTRRRPGVPRPSRWTPSCVENFGGTNTR